MTLNIHMCHPHFSLQYATEIVDAQPEGVAAVLEAIAKREGIAWPPGPMTVFVARDTRPSSTHLSSLTVNGAQALGAKVKDYGLLTTPQLHFIVRMTNAAAAGDSDAASVASEAGYYAQLASAYRDILGPTAANAEGRGPLHLDCAQGVGGPKSRQLAAAMAGLVDIRPRNTGESAADAALLNEGCGAEHCQKERLPPSGFSAFADRGLRLASLDGDADRLVYHYFDDDDASGGGQWKLLDGDKIATLAAIFLAEQLRDLGLPLTAEAKHAHHHHDGASAAVATASSDGAAAHVAPVSVGVVQTAYANGASTAYIRDVLKLPVPLAKTGVKFVHHAALGYDCGVYFEANGHGTVLLHASFLQRLQAMKPEGLSPAAALARTRLLAASRLINQAIGDALSDAMFVEAVLALKGWSIQQWDAVYTDLPSRQCKLPVANRTAIITVDDETRLTSPPELQAAIDALVASVPSGRAFVRPSGTEDVVRVYAEGATQAQADELAYQVALAAYRLGGGVGPQPTKIQ